MSEAIPQRGECHSDGPQSDNEQEMSVLHDAASTCSSCGLSTTRRNVVFGIGRIRTPLMLVGEGPGEQEDATGIPFVGPAGQLLDRAMREAGMLRNHVYIANVVKCRATLLEGGRLRNRVPTTEEIETCVPLWLEKQIAIIRPVVILSIGSPSANAIIHKNFRITRDRGKWFESRYVRYAMATFHPAYVLRQQGTEYESAYRAVVEDLVAAKEKARQVMNETRPA